MSFIDTDLLEKGTQYVLQGIEAIPVDKSILQSPISKDTFPYSLTSGYWEGFHDDIPRELRISACRLVLFSILNTQFGTGNKELSKIEKLLKSLVLADLSYYSALDAFEEKEIKEWVECYFSIVAYVFEETCASQELSLMCDYLESRFSWLSRGYSVSSDSKTVIKAEPRKKPYQILSKVLLQHVNVSKETANAHTLFEAKLNNKFSAFLERLFQLSEYSSVRYNQSTPIDYEQLIKMNNNRSVAGPLQMATISKFDKYLRVMYDLSDPYRMIKNMKASDNRNFLVVFKNTVDFLTSHENSFYKKRYSEKSRFFNDLTTLNIGIHNFEMKFYNSHKADTEMFQRVPYNNEFATYACLSDVSDAETFVQLVEDQESNFFRRGALMKMYFQLKLLQLIIADNNVFKALCPQSLNAFSFECESLQKFCDTAQAERSAASLQHYMDRIMAIFDSDVDFRDYLISFTESELSNLKEKCSLPPNSTPQQHTLEKAVSKEDLPTFNRSFPKKPNVKYGDRNIDRALNKTHDLSSIQTTGGHFEKEITEKYNKLQETDDVAVTLPWKFMPLLNMSGRFPARASSNLEISDFNNNKKYSVRIGDSFANYKKQLVKKQEEFEAFKEANKKYYEGKVAARRKLAEERAKLAEEQAKLRSHHEPATRHPDVPSIYDAGQKRRFSQMTEDMYGDDMPVRKVTRFSNKRLGE
ncbi:hypothetical protein ACO0QE_002743 [Hanseniaspora vineae]